MKIGITSVFFPAVGGMEALTRLLAEAFAARGHEVTVITPTAGDAGVDGQFGFRVIRRPGAMELLGEMARLDVVLQMGIMLRTAWAATLTSTPVVISHQAWLERKRGHLQMLGWLKQRYSTLCGNVVASQALLTEPAGPAKMVPNCYDDRVFRWTNHEPRGDRLIFVGRLVSDKGADLILRALVLLRDADMRPPLTIVGDGPERVTLERMVDDLALRTQVSFEGRQPPAVIAGLLNRSRLLIVPSRWEEPFGIVALEGIACGCTVVASDGGGLREIVGPFGRLFPRNDLPGLFAALQTELRQERGLPDDTSARASYLEQFRPAHMVDRYLESLAARARGRSGRSNG